MRMPIILTYTLIVFIMSSCAMVGSAVASATTGSEVNFGLTKAKGVFEKDE